MVSVLRRLSLALAVLALTGALAAPAVAAAPYIGEDVAIGNPKAKVTVVEYASAACPHCAWFNNEVFPLFKAKYIDTGKVRYVFRELLTDPVAFAGTAFLMARCAGENRYLAVVDTVFHEQARIYQRGDLKAGLYGVGAKFGMTPADVDACARDPKAVAALQARMDLAEKAGVRSTPTFFINDVKKEGEQSLGDLDAIIGPMLAK